MVLPRDELSSDELSPDELSVRRVVSGRVVSETSCQWDVLSLGRIVAGTNLLGKNCTMRQIFRDTSVRVNSVATCSIVPRNDTFATVGRLYGTAINSLGIMSVLSMPSF